MATTHDHARPELAQQFEQAMLMAQRESTDSPFCQPKVAMAGVDRFACGGATDGPLGVLAGQHGERDTPRRQALRHRAQHRQVVMRDSVDHKYHAGRLRSRCGIAGLDSSGVNGHRLAVVSAGPWRATCQDQDA